MALSFSISLSLVSLERLVTSGWAGLPALAYFLFKLIRLPLISKGHAVKWAMCNFLGAEQVSGVADATDLLKVKRRCWPGSVSRIRMGVM